MNKLIEGAKEALAVAGGETPAASIYHNGHRYVAMEEYERLRAKLEQKRGKAGLRQRAREIGISPTTLSRFESGKEPDMKTARKVGPYFGKCPCCEQPWPGDSK